MSGKIDAVYEEKEVRKHYTSGAIHGLFTRIADGVLAEGLDLISAEQAALLRRVTDYNADARSGHDLDPHDIHDCFYTREGYLWLPEEKQMYLTKKSPCLVDCEKVERETNDRHLYHPSETLIEEALMDSCLVENGDIPIEELADAPEFKFLFGEEAEPYANYIRERWGAKSFSFDKKLTEKHTYRKKETEPTRPVAGQCHFLYVFKPGWKEWVNRIEMDTNFLCWNADRYIRWISEDPEKIYTGEFVHESVDDIHRALMRIGRKGFQPWIKGGKEGPRYECYFYREPFIDDFEDHLEETTEEERKKRVKKALKERGLFIHTSK
jgi:hypothetical protein